MTTLSQLVDEMTLEFIRPDLQDLYGVVSAYLNQTVRELHTGQGGVTHKFADNRVELLIDTGILTKNSFIWEIENYNRFQSLEAAEYPKSGRKCKPLPPAARPGFGREKYEDQWSWYQSGSGIVFSGIEDSGPDSIAVSALYYPRSLVYKEATADRWATYDVETETWKYIPGSGLSQEELRARSTNWILMRWTDTVKEGIRAKVYKRLGDDSRMRSSYSSYMQSRLEMQAQEVAKYGAMYEH